MGKKKVFYGLILTILLISCGSTAPFAERDAATKSIELAKSVEANKYSPNEIDKATAEFDSAQKLIVEDGKSKQNDEAKTKYLEADKQAKEAYANSVGPFIESFIQKTDEAIEKARSIKTDIALPDSFEAAVSKNMQSRDALNNKNYEQAKTISLEAYDIIQEAITETMELREHAISLDQQYESILADLKAQKAEAAIPDEYKDAKANLEDIRTQFEEGYYFEVVSQYQDGILDADDLIALIEEKRRAAQEALEAAEESIQESQTKAGEVETQ